jgi:adenylyltransferase/sulfurtransferase
MTAVRELAAANPSLALEVLNAANTGRLQDWLADIDLVLYEDSNRERRKLISDACRKLRKPWTYAEARGGSGMVVNVMPGKAACIDCVKSKVGTLDDGTEILADRHRSHRAANVLGADDGGAENSGQ